jgi:O-antigen ligase
LKAAQPPRPKIDVALILLLITGFLAPLFGGYIVSDATTLPRGLTAALVEAFGGSNSPVLSHLAIALPLLLAVVVALLSRRVQQVPKQIYSAVWILFFGFLGVATLFTSYRSLSIELWIEWICYGCAMFGAVAICGRRQGVTLLTSAIAVGCFFVAVKALREYGEIRSSDPSWRVFAGWVNPNATAAILLIGLFLAIGLCLTQSKLGALAAGLGAALIVVGMVLTGSKGAVSLALPVGLLAFGVFQVRSPRLILPTFLASILLALIVGVLFLKNVGYWGALIGLGFGLAALMFGSRDKLGAARLLTIALIAASFLVLLNVTTPGSKPAATDSGGHIVSNTPIGRVASGSQTQEQSSEFRINLWKSAAFLIKQRPLRGFGLGSYRNESARAGLTTSTVFAHNVFLQIWAETGSIPFLLLLIGVAYWIRLVARSRTNLPTNQLPLLAAVVGGVASILAHSLVDSDLYYFGIGIVFFLALAIGLNLAGDAVAPELVRKPVRILSVMTCLGVVGLLSLFAVEDVQKSVVRQDLASRDAQSVRADLDELAWANSFDGEALYLQGYVMALEGNPQQNPQIVAILKNAYDLYPSDKIGRLFAKLSSASGKIAAAKDVIDDCLDRDPDNLRTLSLLMTIQLDNGKTQDAMETANRLVAVEATPYFKIRSIPENVPTETFDARLNVLAPNTANRRERANLLTAAVRGYLPYASMTFGIMKHSAKVANDPTLQLPGYDTIKEGAAKIQNAISGANQAAELYRALGNPSGVSEMERDEADLRAALAD